jgi:hypothetical protein
LLGNAAAMLFPTIELTIRIGNGGGYGVRYASTSVVRLPKSLLKASLEQLPFGSPNERMHSTAKTPTRSGASRRYVEENFSIEKMIRGYVNVYRETLEPTATDKIA